MNEPQKIENEWLFLYKFTFCTLVTKYPEYQEMIDSAKRVGFHNQDVEYLYFDNRNSNIFDGYSGLNKAIREAKGEYLIFCHQDIIFHDDGRKQLESCLVELEKIDKKWAIAGNAGKDENGSFIARISDPHGVNIKKGSLPCSVVSLDENFLIINRKNNVSCSNGLYGYHLYGTDLCQNAIDLGLKAYVINFHLFHKSGGYLDQSFFDSRNRFIEFYRLRKQTKIIYTTCTSFLVSKFRFLSKLFDSNFKYDKKGKIKEFLVKYKKYL